MAPGREGAAAGGARPRFLVTSHVVPWPEVSGSCIRAAATIRGLAQVGDVDVFVLHPDTERPAALPADVPVERWGGAAPSARRPGLSRYRWLLDRHVPPDLARTDFAAVRARFSRWARPPYDLVWFIDGDGAFAALSDLVDDPIVANLNDIEDHKLRAQAEAATRRSPGVRGLVDPALLRLELHRWRLFHERMARQADTIVVCSELDRKRLGARNAVVIPNIYPEPERELGRAAVGDPPTVTFVGQQTYAPNADGSAWLVGEVLPHLRTAVPGVRVRLVGETGPAVESLGDADDVTVTGLVPDIADELARADVAVGPIRYGGGTRIKLLEAVAHRIPVVSTTLGAEGLDAVDGEHLLIADEPGAFARACTKVLTDPELRGRMTAAAHALWSERFTATAMARQVGELARSVVDRRPAGPARAGSVTTGGVQ